MKAGQFYKNIKKASLITICSEISEKENDLFYNNTVKADANKVEGIIKKFLPDLADQLALQYHNPFRNQSVRKEGLVIYVHSATDYFIKVE